MTKIALITGANRGLGRQTALDIARQGGDVIVTYRGSLEQAEAVVADIRVATIGPADGIPVRLDSGSITGGGTIFTAGIVLAVMILPVITAVTREVFIQTPRSQIEAALALGATRWEMVRMAVFPFARAGIVSAIMLGLGRALGETMAVTFVIGNMNQLNSLSVFEAANSITSALANEFAEAGEGLHQASLIYLGLVLFFITFVVLALSKMLLSRLQKGEGARA